MKMSYQRHDMICVYLLQAHQDVSRSFQITTERAHSLKYNSAQYQLQVSFAH